MATATVRTLESLLDTNRTGTYQGKLQWSFKRKESYHENIIKIDETGKLKIINEREEEQSYEEVLIDSLHSCSLQIIENGGILKVQSLNNTIYIKCPDKQIYLKLFSTLLIWQNLKAEGAFNKILVQNFNSNITEPREILSMSNCNVFATIPFLSRNRNKMSNVKVLDRPKFPVSLTKQKKEEEKWFKAKLILLSNGYLQVHSTTSYDDESTLLYNVDITKLYSDEIHPVHKSIYNSSILNDSCSYLSIAKLKALRMDQQMTTSDEDEIYDDSITDTYPKQNRIIIEFPNRYQEPNEATRINDWLILLRSYTMRQDIGINNDTTDDFSFRVCQVIGIDILEASCIFSPTENEKRGIKNYLYAVILISGIPWFQTALVESSESKSNDVGIEGYAFFREEFKVEIPFLIKSFDIVLKKNNNQIEEEDMILGVTRINIQEIPLNNPRLPLYTDFTSTIKTGTIFITLKSTINYIMPSVTYNNFEKILDKNLSMGPFLSYANVLSRKYAEVSEVLLDVFLCLDKARYLFSGLIEYELSQLISSTNNGKEHGFTFYNTLFRGNSLLTKTLESYNCRIGQIYIDTILGEFITKVLVDSSSCEIDPTRLKPNEDLEANYESLLGYLEMVWFKIYQSSNDIPYDMKVILNLFRTKLESIKILSSEMVMNCLSGFIFLRFFCPVLLNPKLFNITTNHQTEKDKRTLTLISKILLMFANRGEFGAKEPYLTRFNKAFIDKYQVQLMDYYDKITLKKSDFSPRLMSWLDSERNTQSSKKIDTVDVNRDRLRELPMGPLLIDKYLRIDQLMELITSAQNQENMETLDPKQINQANSTLRVLMNESARLSLKKYILLNRLDPSQSITSISEHRMFVREILQKTTISPKNHMVISTSSFSSVLTNSRSLASTLPLLRFKFDTTAAISSLTTTISSSKSYINLNIQNHPPSTTTNTNTSNLRSKNTLPQMGSSTDLKLSPTKKLQRIIKSASLNALSLSSATGGSRLEFGEDGQFLNGIDDSIDMNNSDGMKTDISSKRKSGFIRGWLQSRAPR